MKLSLTNFKCHSSKVIEISDYGTTLLSGGNGTGKTTIIEAIIYVLYNKVKNPSGWFGTERTSVCLEMEMMSVTRYYDPMVLEVELNTGEKYEAQVAQEIINTKIMNYYEFVASSLFHSKLNIITLTAQERIDFIWKLDSNNVNADVYSTNIKNYMKNLHSQIPEISTKIEMTKEQIKLLQDKLPEDIEDIVSSFEDTTTVLKEEIDAYFNEVEVLNEKLNTLKEQYKKIKKDTEEISSIDSQIKLLRTKLCGDANVNKEDLSNRFSLVKQSLDINKICLEKSKLIAEKEENEKAIEHLKKDYKKNITKELEKIKKNDTLLSFEELLQKRERLTEEYECQQKSLGEYEKNKAMKEESMHKIKQITLKCKKEFGFKLKKVVSVPLLLEFLHEKETELEKDTSDLQMHIQSISHKFLCPECNTRLIVSKDGSSIIKYKKIKTSNDTDKLKDMKQKLCTITEYIAEIDMNKKNIDLNISENDVKKVSYDDIKDVETAISVNKRVEELEDKLNHDPSSVKELQDKCDEISKLLKSKKYALKLDANKNYEQEIYHDEQKIKKITNSIDTINSSEETKKEIKTEIKKLQEKKKSIKLPKKYENVPDDIEKLEVKLGETTSKIKSHTTLLNEKLNTYKLCKKYYKYKTSLDTVNELENDLLNLEADLLRSGRIKTRIKDAKIGYITNFVEKLNLCVKHFEKHIFEDTNFFLKIEKEKGTTKLKFDISHKGKSNVRIAELSAGELQKCRLVFLLALNKVFNSPYLLMDEFLHSTDENKSTDILKYLKHFSNNKMILCILHKCSSGIFDNVIDVEEESKMSSID